MTIINTTNINLARKQIQKAKPPIIVQAQNDSFNRKILEQNKNLILLFPDNSNRKDKIKQLDSGLNHVLAKIATKNHIKIGINLHSLQKLDNKQKAIQLARIKQNIQICKKAKTPMRIYPLQENPEQTKALLLSLKASTSQAKQATTF